MANTPVEVKKTVPAAANAPDTWRSFRTEMDRLFDRFAGGWGMPSLRRMFDAEPAFRYESSFTMPSPAVDISEDDGAYKVTAELPGMAEQEIEVVVSGDTLSIKGEKRRRRSRRRRTSICPNVPTGRSSAASTCRKAWIATRSRLTSPRVC